MNPSTPKPGTGVLGTRHVALFSSHLVKVPMTGGPPSAESQVAMGALVGDAAVVPDEFSGQVFENGRPVSCTSSPLRARSKGLPTGVNGPRTPKAVGLCSKKKPST